MDDDEDMRGQGTLVMRPEDPPSDAEPATLLRSPSDEPVVPPRGGTMQMRSVDPYARTVPPGLGDLEPVVRIDAPPPAPPAAEPAVAPTPSPPSLGSAPPFTAPLVVPTDAAPPPKKSALPVLLGVAIGLFSVLSVVGILVLLLGPKPEDKKVSAVSAGAGSAASATAVEEGPSASAAPATPAPTMPVGDVGSAPPPTASAAAALPEEGPEAEAIAALEQLKAAIATCVKTKIHKLPGTSPAIPPALTYLKNGPYKPLITDWTSPFFSCAPLKIDKPMPFVIQWQFHKPTASGMGIAWVDLDGNGVAEKAFAFKATLEKKDDLVLSAIEPIDAVSHRPERAH